MYIGYSRIEQWFESGLRLMRVLRILLYHQFPRKDSFLFLSNSGLGQCCACCVLSGSPLRFIMIEDSHFLYTPIEPWFGSVLHLLCVGRILLCD